ncbi:MAG: hypothetical protein Q7W45_16465 [Bacteroidota bacterium]|nr:hypothetical protein [Bacteroidota bacterium]MDP3145389.1 hypothetical protein [Bacteroidota bacterium]MDP3557592.1 hypothetical protein [Bacteroidota bacterium]
MRPIDPYVSVSIKAQTLAKYHAVITFLETEANYKPEMTEEDFIKNCLAFLGCAKIPDFLKSYYGFIYEFHVSGVSSDTVYEKTDGRAFTEFANALIERIKPGMTQIEFENNLVEGYPVGGGDKLKKPWWVNPIRKIIDWIDDNWK